MKNFIKKWWGTWMILFVIWLSYHMYFLYLAPIEIGASEVYYLDFMLLLVVVSWIVYQYQKEFRHHKEIITCIQEEEYISIQDLPHVEEDYAKLLLHNEAMYQKELEHAFQRNHDLQEYISRWSHEIKLPLAALQMMNERNEDVVLRGEMKEQCEKMEQLLHTMLTGCKTWNTHYDKTIAPISLKEVITKSIHHQSYFLIKERFEIAQRVQDENVLSDEQWLVYMLDQILHNAIKYHKEKPKLSFYTETIPNGLVLHIRDEGIGIRKEDMQSLFDKGYTGRNVRNGEYRSTGMGLYFVKQICDMLGHKIHITSLEQQYTDVQITFENHLDFFNITDL